MEIYELSPRNGRKSFYGKAKVQITKTAEILLSYDTKIIKRDLQTGNLVRLYRDGPSYTTCCHIYSFCGLRKRDFLKL